MSSEKKKQIPPLQAAQERVLQVGMTRVGRDGKGVVGMTRAEAGTARAESG